jgi:PTH1 family peptidyl-tRNA hydrolase
VKLIVGLGNPGERYRLTRHNLGFLAVDRFTESCGYTFKKKKHSALFVPGAYAGEEFLAIKPATFMNRSGEAVLPFLSEYALTPEDVIVLSDDVHIRFGSIRIRKAGSSGGHNGLRSITECLGSDAFMRLRLGVGAPPDQEADLADYVLSAFFDAELPLLPVFLDHICGALALVLQGNTDKAMNTYHGRDCTEA